VKTAEKTVSVKVEREKVMPYSYEERQVHFVMN
jgi:oligosaccharyltransferase complex subunit alpha (ribophorin I)